MPVEESQRALWFAEFERTGESFVRMEVDSDNGSGNLSRLACAKEWLRGKDQDRIMRLHSETQRWARHAAYAAYIAAAAAIAEIIRSIIMI